MALRETFSQSRSAMGRARAFADRHGPRQGHAELVRSSTAYWTNPRSENWASNSHWRGALGDHWGALGREHLERVQTMLGRNPHARGDGAAGLGRVLDWGGGGGANAVALAPEASELIVTDISATSLEECRRQVEAMSTTPLRTIELDPECPERALDDIEPGSIDLFVSFYVFELLPTKEYARRVLSIARRLLDDAGMALIQIKYQNSDPSTRSPKRGYARNLANMTTFEIDEFWALTELVGFDPQSVSLVLRNALDERYAYFELAPR